MGLCVPYRALCVPYGPAAAGQVRPRDPRPTAPVGLGVPYGAVGVPYGTLSVPYGALCPLWGSECPL